MKTDEYLSATEDLNQRFTGGMSRMDIEQVMSCFWNSPDLILVFYDGTVLHGFDNVRRVVEQMFAQCESLSLVIDEVSHVRQGESVFAVGTATYEMKTNDGISQKITERWTDVRRKVDGVWVYVMDHAHALAPKVDPEQMTAQVQVENQNKAVVQHYWNGKFNERRPEILDELQTPDVIYHGTSMNMNGVEEYKQVYGSYLSAFHDTHITVEELIAEGDKVMSRVSLSGAHKGEFDGMPPTGKAFTVNASTIFRLVDGKIVEEWEIFDELGLMHQLGMELRPTSDVEPNELARDLEAITALREENLAAINASDVSTLLTTFTDDVVFLPDDQPPVVGKAALEAWARPIYEQYDFNIEGTVKEVVVAGDWAFEWGLLTGTMRLLEGGEDMQVDMKYVYIYQRQPDGSWKCAYDIVNKNVPSSVYPVPIKD